MKHWPQLRCEEGDPSKRVPVDARCRLEEEQAPSPLGLASSFVSTRTRRNGRPAVPSCDCTDLAAVLSDNTSTRRPCRRNRHELPRAGRGNIHDSRSGSGTSSIWSADAVFCSDQRYARPVASSSKIITPLAAPNVASSSRSTLSTLRRSPPERSTAASTRAVAAACLRERF